MAKYNSDCKNEYAMQLMGECFRNSLKYYKKNVFDPVRQIERTLFSV